MNRILAIGAGATVAILVIIAAMVPLTTSMSEEIHSTESNENVVRYSLAETHSRTIIEVIDGIGYINDKPIKDNFGRRQMMFSDTFILQYESQNEPNSFLKMFYLKDGVGQTPIISQITAYKNTWTAITSTNEMITGSYAWLMAWNPNGDYGAIPSGELTSPAYINADAEIFICGAGTTDFSLQKGTINNVSNVMISGNAPTITQTVTQYTTTPNVMELSAFQTSTIPSAIYIPMKYDVITSTDEIIKTIINLMPLFTGIILFAAMGLSMMRLTRSN